MHFLDIVEITHIPDLAEEIIIGLTVAWLARRPWGKRLIERVKTKINRDAR